MSRRSGLAPLLALAMAGAVAVIGFSRVLFPYDIGHYEANAWAPAELLAHGHDPYDLSRTTSPPYVAAPYGPLHYALTGVGLRLFGENFWFARLGSVLATLATALCVAAICYRLSGRSRGAAGIGALAFLASFPVMFWVGLQRADVFALLLSMVAVLLAVRGAEDERSGLSIGAGLAAAGAVLFRQTALLPFLMVLAIYLLRRDPAGAMSAFGAGAALLAAAYAALELSSGGGDALHQLYTSQRGVPFDASLLSTRVRALVHEPITLVVSGWLVVVLVWAAGQRRRRRSTVVPLWLLLAYLIAATGLAALTSARAGANLNYWLEPAAVAALLVGTLSSELSSWRPYLPSLVAASLIAASLLSVVRVAHGEWLRWEARPYLDDVTQAVRAHTSRVEPSFSVYPELVTKANRRSFVNDYVQYDGRDPRLAGAYRRLLRSGRLGAIVTHARESPPGYERVHLAHPVPAGIFPVYVHVRSCCG